MSDRAPFDNPFENYAKRTEATSANETFDFRQNHSQHYTSPPTSSRTGSTHGFKATELRWPPQPHELTAEWTVRAQLTFARAGESVRREFSTNDPLHPVRVVYKWCTLDPAAANASATTQQRRHQATHEEEDADTNSSTLLSHKRGASTSRSSGQSTPQSKSQHLGSRLPLRHESFRSTTSSTNAGDFGAGDSGLSGSHTSKQATANSTSEPTTAAFAAPGNGMASATHYGTRCRSTCNIVVSAVADFLPPDATTATIAAVDLSNLAKRMDSHGILEEENEPFVYNTTASYTMLPQKSFDGSLSPLMRNTLTTGRILALRDNFCQTSDTETKYFEEKQRLASKESDGSLYKEVRRRHANTGNIQQTHRNNNYRRSTTDSLLPTPMNLNAFPVDEEQAGRPSFMPSPTQTFKSSSLPRIPPLPGQQYPKTCAPAPATATPQKSHSSGTGGTAEAQKKPRTVHIDVYCTGSEDEDEDEDNDAEDAAAPDADAESTDSSHAEAELSKSRTELDSNSTPQTVLNTEQMLLRHQRVLSGALPRRLAQHQQQQPKYAAAAATEPTNATTALVQTHSSSNKLNLGHAITKSSTAEEVSESKQLLFRKHIGDQRAAKLLNLREKYRRQTSDDVLSSNYPNSSRSTMRDATCSSISSAVPSNTPENGGSAWRHAADEHTHYASTLDKSDSFEYENALDRLRIKQMEQYWSNGERASLENEPPQVTPYTTAPIVPYTSVYASESEHYSETDVFYTYPGPGRLSCSPLRQTPSLPAPQLQQTSHFLRHRPGFLQFFGPQTPSPEPPRLISPTPPASAPIMATSSQAHLLYPNYQPSSHLQRWKSEARDNLSDHTCSPSNVSSTHSPGSPSNASMHSQASPRSTFNVSPTATPTQSSHAATPTQRTSPLVPLRCGSETPFCVSSSAPLSAPPPVLPRRFDFKQASPAVSDTSTVVSGYTTEYLEKARKFGKVVSTARKPGHHVGPTKNPCCSCESCQRWRLERFQPRARAFSLGEQPVLKPVK